MTEGRLGDAFALAFVGGVAAVGIGYAIANHGNSDSLLGIQEAMRGVAVAVAILAAVSFAAVRVARRAGPDGPRRLARLLAWAAFVPAAAWTALLGLVVLATSGGHEAMAVEDVAPDWAIIALPLFAASGLLFWLARRGSERPRDR